MSLIAPIRRNHPALSTRGLPAPVFPAVPQRPRCPRCHKTLAGGVDLGWVCPSCDYCEPGAALVARAKPRPADAPEGVVIPMVYSTEPFPEPDWSDDEPALFPVATATADPLRLSEDCRRCGRHWQRCTCVLMPDRRRVAKS